MTMRRTDDAAATERVEARNELSGLEYMRKLAAGELPPSGMGQLLGFRLIEVSEGRAVFTVTPAECHYNGLGIAHGGLAATVLDSALGCAVNTMLPAGRIFTTLEMKINFVRPLRRETGEVRCEATALHVGGRTATAEGRIVDRAGKLYAHGTATCILFRA
jgi:uncharacterized protein (TIGR00369 family)